MSLEQTLCEIRDNLAMNNTLLQQLIAGREDALAQLKGAAATADAPKPTRTRRSTKTDEGASSGADSGGATEGTGGDTAGATEQPSKRPIDTSDDGLRKIAGQVMAKAKTDELRAQYGAKVKAILDHFGSPMLAGEKSTLDADQRYQAHFLLERLVADLPIDLSVDYDFDADPLTQFVPEKASGGDFIG